MKKLEEKSVQLSFFDKEEVPFLKYYPALLYIGILISFLVHN